MQRRLCAEEFVIGPPPHAAPFLTVPKLSPLAVVSLQTFPEYPFPKAAPASATKRFMAVALPDFSTA